MAGVRRLLPVVITGLLIVAALAPVTIPRRLQREAAAAELVSVSLRVPILGEPTQPVDAIDTPMLRAHRSPEWMVWPVLDRRLAAELDSLVASWPEPYCLTVSVDGRPIYSTGTAPQIPASVQKIVTSAAVLTHMDAEARLVTRVVTEGVVVDGVVGGDVYVIGGGDPLLSTEPYADAYSRQPQLRTPIEDLADRIAAAGITRINGRLIGDESRHDEIRYVETWPDRYRAQHNSGPLSALTVNDGFTRWTPSRVDSSQPALHFVDVLRALLSERGVTVANGTSTGVASEASTLLTEIESPTVGEMVSQMLRESDNNTAEVLLKELGLLISGQPSTAAGADVAATTVAALLPGLNPPVVFDGSGLDRANQVSCPFLVGLLDHFGPDSVLGSGLAVAAESGTLGHRFTETELAGILHAKTGLLNSVNGLAGYIDRPDGGQIAFAQLLNGVPLTGRLGIDIQEELVFALARHLEPLNPEVFAP